MIARKGHFPLTRKKRLNPMGSSLFEIFKLNDLLKLNYSESSNFTRIKIFHSH